MATNKNMTLEEKAIAYDKAIEKIKYVMEHGVSPVLNKKDLQDIFPELKGSEDEKIKKAIISYIDYEGQRGGEWFGVKVDDIIAWLEKQGQKDSDPRYKYLEELLAADDMYQMAMNDKMVQNAKEKTVSALNKMAIGDLIGEQKLAKDIIDAWKDMRFEVYAQASGNRHEANYSDNSTKMFSLNDIDEIIEKISEQKCVNNVKPKFLM